jgi:hypothetical protein
MSDLLALTLPKKQREEQRRLAKGRQLEAVAKDEGKIDHDLRDKRQGDRSKIMICTR